MLEMKHLVIHCITDGQKEAIDLFEDAADRANGIYVEVDYGDIPKTHGYQRINVSFIDVWKNDLVKGGVNPLKNVYIADETAVIMDELGGFRPFSFVFDSDTVRKSREYSNMLEL